MIKFRIPQRKGLISVTGFSGESIEEKMRRINKEGMGKEETAPVIFTERKDGVLPAYDIRTDRFEVAAAAMDKMRSVSILKRVGGPVNKEDGQSPASSGTE